MANGIKYSASLQTRALKKGNFWIATGDTDLGPTSTTGYYTAVSPITGGYSIYVDKASQGPSIFVAPNDASLIQYTKVFSGTTFATGPSALNWYNTQTDKMVLNIDYPAIVTNGLYLNLDAGFTPSYPRQGTVWYDLGITGGNGELVNGPTYGASGGGTIIFDGTDDYVQLQTSNLKFNDKNLTLEVMVEVDGNPDVYFPFITLWDRTKPFSYGPGISISKARSGIYNGSAYASFTDNSQNQIQVVDTATGNELSAGSYYHFVLVLEKVSGNYQIRLYRNGFITGTTISNTTTYNFSTVSDVDFLSVIGLASGFFIANAYLKGNLPIARIYDRALTAPEILQNYQAILPRFLGQNIVSSGLTYLVDPGYLTCYSSGSTVYNVGGASGGNGSLTNGTTYSSVNGGTFSFDGTDDYITLSYTSSIFGIGTADFTYTVWYYPDTNSPVMRLFSIGEFAAGGNFQFERADNSRVVVHVNGSYIIFSSTNNTGVWHYYVVTRRSGTVTVYQNGVSIGTASMPGAITNTSSPTIGSNGPQVSVVWDGYISVTSIYNRALSASEVLQNFNAQKTRFGL